VVPRVCRADALSTGLIAAGAGAAAIALTLTLRGDKKLEQRVDELEIEAAEKTSSAFVFIKSHAVTDEVKALVKERLEKVGISIVSEGVIAAEKIDKEQLIDTHYGAIASKAMKQKPAALTVQPKAQDEFKKAFGLSWSEALSKGLVYNAVDACAKLGTDFDGLGQKWSTLKKGVNLLKFGGGFYCAKVGDIFVINGFYMDMRKAFTAPGTSIYYYETQWAAKDLAWGDFRGKVLGGTDPKTADAGSLRNDIFKNWQSLKLKAVPNTGDNGVHASASPFEALAERANWLGASLSRDQFGKALLASGVPLKMVKAWTDDPPVSFEGKKQSLFDLLEDMDGTDCLEKAAKIAAQN
jgi:nucleoside diphosphate kinase